MLLSIGITTHQGSQFSIRILTETKKITLVQPVGVSFFRFGYCVSIHLNPEILEKSVRMINIAWKNDTVSSEFYFNVHHPQNTWPYMPINANNWKLVYTNSSEAFNLDFEILHFLRFKTTKCEQNPDYNIDDCFEKSFNGELMKNFGCIAKFGNNKTNVCPEGSKKEKAAYGNLKKMIYGRNYNACTYPCLLMDAKLIPSMARFLDHPSLKLDVSHFIKVTTFRYSYTELELLAELGGYVGLFLGISVFHLSDLFDSILHWFTW